MSPSAKRPFEGNLAAATFDWWNRLRYEENRLAAHAYAPRSSERSTYSRIPPWR